MKELWRETFQMHHYMSSALLDNAVADVLRLAPSREIVGFIATASQPGIHEPGKSCADSRPVRREHRLVVLPRWQGCAIGPRLSDLSAAMWTATRNESGRVLAAPDSRNFRYMCRTSHPRFGLYREQRSHLWQPTSANRESSHARYCRGDRERPQTDAEAWSHEFIGAPYAFADGERRKVPAVTAKARAKAAKAARVASGQSRGGPLSAFNMFVEERRAANPPTSAQWVEFSREAGRCWRALDKEGKRGYEQRARERNAEAAAAAPSPARTGGRLLDAAAGAAAGAAASSAAGGRAARPQPKKRRRGAESSEEEEEEEEEEESEEEAVESEEEESE